MHAIVRVQCDARLIADSVPPIPSIVPPQQGPILGRPDDQEHDGDDGGPTDLGDD